MARRALLVGINQYQHFGTLAACVPDAESMAELLARNGDGGPNFDCRMLLGTDTQSVTRALLRQRWRELFQNFNGDVLFYFSGHGIPSDVGGYLATQEGTKDDPGLPMQEIVDMANNSSAATVLLILDCCFSGSAGNPGSLRSGSIENKAILREGVTIIAASSPGQTAMEVGGHGVFTNLVLGALRGGAANVRGEVSAASIYAYAEAALGPWDQRPLYKSHAARLEPVRKCMPAIPDTFLRELPTYFPHSQYEYRLDQTYEETNGCARPDHVAIFKKFKRFQIGGLLRPKVGDDLYWSAERSGYVVLTDLGEFYLKLVINGRI
jgi:Caspase domain